MTTEKNDAEYTNETLSERVRMVGDGGWISMRRVVAIGRWESAPMKRLAREAKTAGRLVDLTYGSSCKYVYYLDSGHVVLGNRDIPELEIKD